MRYANLPLSVLPDVEVIRADLNAQVEVKVAAAMHAARIRCTAELLIQLTDGNKAITCIRIIRTAFGLGLKEAKDAYDLARESLDLAITKGYG